jgi:dipeptidase E
MGKIIALGGGVFENGEVLPIIEKIFEMCDKNDPSVLYLPTAGFDDMSDAEIILKPFKERSTDVESLLLTDESLTDEEIKNKILSADIIYVGGGNLEFLMNTFKKTKADKYLKQAYENGTVLSGLSSGAMCWFEMGWDDCGEDHSFVFIECLGILDGCFCPHYEGASWNKFKEAIKTIDFDGIAAEDGAALTYVDGVFGTVSGTEDGDVFVFKRNNDYKEELYK